MASRIVDPQARSAPAASTLTESNYRFLQDYIYRESGIVIDADKHYLLETRLLPLARQCDIGSLNALCDALRGHRPALRQKVIDAITTNETLWFREPAQFDALRQHILPELIAARAAERRLSIWSAAASSGQELYSVAMTLLDVSLTGWNLRLLGTDLSLQILERAVRGRYLQLEVNRGLPAQYLVKYFRRVGLDWQLNDEVRRMCEFRQFDLRSSAASLGKFDIVFCRNVLIYFDHITKTKILNEIARTLYPGGYLFLGTAETILNLQVPFERLTIGPTVVYRAPS